MDVVRKESQTVPEDPKVSRRVLRPTTAQTRITQADQTIVMNATARDFQKTTRIVPFPSTLKTTPKNNVESQLAMAEDSVRDAPGIDLTAV